MMLELALAGALVTVFDGDTLRVQNETFRLVGFDTPELSSGKCAAERRLATQARLRLKELVKEPTAKLQEVLCHGSNYGRKCAVVTVNGKNIATLMVRERLANDYWCGSGGCPKRADWCSRDR
jgi:endonuclease YncB( thermonuclease family)